jgi:hypothetical protein
MIRPAEIGLTHDDDRNCLIRLTIAESRQIGGVHNNHRHCFWKTRKNESTVQGGFKKKKTFLARTVVNVRACHWSYGYENGPRRALCTLGYIKPVGGGDVPTFQVFSRSLFRLSNRYDQNANIVSSERRIVVHSLLRPEIGLSGGAVGYKAGKGDKGLIWQTAGGKLGEQCSDRRRPGT